MKTMKIVTALAALILSGTASAQTPLKLNTQTIGISGKARASGDISALAFYTPLATFDKKLSIAACEFKEDRSSPNLYDKNLNVKSVRQADGSYSLQIPTAGQRGECPYVLESLYFYVEDGDTSMTLNMKTERTIQREKELLEEVGGMEPVKSLSELPAIYCEFEDEYDVGSCSSVKGNIELTYQVSNTPKNYILNIQDLKEMPEREY